MKTTEFNYDGIVQDHRAYRAITQGRWYVLANARHATLYVDRVGHPFEFLKRISNTAYAASEAGYTDRPGRTISSSCGGTLRHSLSQRQDLDDKITQDFAREIAETLKSEKQDQLMTEITLVAEPRFLGLLRKALEPSIRVLVKDEINREFLYGSDLQLHKHIQNALADQSSHA